ncbi:MAG: ABC transporter ATP-binding protein [Sphingomonadales bacterium]
MNRDALKFEGIVRTFRQGSNDLEVLTGVSLAIKPGEIVGLLGPSGAGKSTLLHIVGLLEHADEGEIWIDGSACGVMRESRRTVTRRHELGFVYQFHHLMPEFSAVENVVMPQMIAGKSRDQAREKAADMLARLGLAERLDHRPAQLSGGEQQRVAIARAMANDPKVLLADEPTGNLDERTAELVFAELLTLVREQGAAALIATHNSELADRMDRRVVLHNGVLIED